MIKKIDKVPGAVYTNYYSNNKEELIKFGPVRKCYGQYKYYVQILDITNPDKFYN